MKIVAGKKYRIKTFSPFFFNKYGDGNPVIVIEDEHKKVFGQWWGTMKGNPAAIFYALRSSLLEELPSSGEHDDVVFYGKIRGLGELVHEIELEEYDEKAKAR
jgi:hypothetical protein